MDRSDDDCNGLEDDDDVMMTPQRTLLAYNQMLEIKCSSIKVHLASWKVGSWVQNNQSVCGQNNQAAQVIKMTIVRIIDF